MRISDWSSDVCSSDLVVPPFRKTLFRPRTLSYFGLWGAIGLAMLFTLGQRTRLDLSVQHERSPLYVQLSDGAIRNNYTLKLRNMEIRPRTVEVSLNGLSRARLEHHGGVGARAGPTGRMPVVAEMDGVRQ